MKNTILITIIILSLLSGKSQDFALKQLEDSPLHHEWVQVEVGDKPLHLFVVYPESAEKATAVIVIHENKGLTNWVRSIADQLAAKGYIAIAPDMLSGFSEEFQATNDFKTMDDARNAIYQLDAEQVKKFSLASYKYAKALPAANGKVAAMGFCWGGSQTFRFATFDTDIGAFLVFYGGAPDTKEEIEKIEAPVYGFYGGNDNRVNAGIPGTTEMMSAAGKKYDAKIYPGAGHGFMRQGDDPEGSAENKQARNEAWVRMLKILAEL